MNKCGINKEVDKLGRIVIPKEMRELFNITERVELVVTDEGILLRNPKYKLTRKNDGN
ncbi:MAG: AbrB/MazE/SpoVT family DNA-binding domain-containing protein [Clostridia bacterium]|nr:AbrB/MazE/SpoVT family DNA-binding domain-containing protein [Clostridia bacterium]